MRSLFKKVLQTTLAIFTRAVLRRYQPTVVAVTGSVGKTSTVEAIYTVVAKQFRTRKSLKNYNNEIGIPLSVIGSESGGSSPWRWLGVLLKACKLLLSHDRGYPKLLILELGADHPGDLGYLIKLVPVSIAVVTSVAPVHLEWFKTVAGVAAEKSRLVQAVPPSGQVILNSDDPLVRAMASGTAAPVIGYGLLEQAHVRGSNIRVSPSTGADGTTAYGVSFDLTYQQKTMAVDLPQVLGQHFVYSALAAVAVGLALQLPLETIVNELKNFVTPRGRMRVIGGIKQAILIDDSYNSSPFSARSALHQLKQLLVPQAARRFAVLGDMLELGGYTEQGHQEVGEAVADYKIDYLITVGEMSRDITRGALAKGFNRDHTFHFKNSVEAGKFLQDRLSPGDLILIKGSQGVRMEKAVKELMADPARAAELLVRQEKFWQ